MYIDSHCHLTHEAFEKDVEEVIKRAEQNNVRRIYCTGGMLGHDEKVLALCSKYARVLSPVIGISPHDASKISKEEKNHVFDLIEKNRKKLSAIGEIGLDFHYFHEQEQQKQQEKIFREQIELARTLDLPVVIHSRKAEEKVLNILEELKFKQFAMHCFIVKNLCTKVVKQGGIISLPTIKSKDRKYIMKNIELENLLCETDSPYLWSGRNEPANVVEVYSEISKAKEIEVNLVAEKIMLNAKNFFR